MSIDYVKNWMELFESVKQKRPIPSDFIQPITDAMRRGLNFKAACELVGLSYDVGQYWRLVGSGKHHTTRSTPETYEFAHAVLKARAEFDLETVEEMKQTAKVDPKSWRARAWLYEPGTPGYNGDLGEDDKSANGVTVIFKRPQMTNDDDGDSLDPDD